MNEDTCGYACRFAPKEKLRNCVYNICKCYKEGQNKTTMWDPGETNGFDLTM